MDYDKSAESNIVANLCDAEKKSAAGWWRGMRTVYWSVPFPVVYAHWRALANL